MVGLGAKRRILLLLLGLTLVSALGFILVILAKPQNGVGIHEVAGLILLVLILGALWAAGGLRSWDRRPIVRVVVALIGLVAAGIIGATLASGAVSGAAAGLPLVPLAVVVGAAADGIRVTRRASARGPGGLAGSRRGPEPPV